MAKKQKVLSIIIPSYNMQEYLARCLSSLLNDKLREEIEVIIVNDGSSDDTEAIACSIRDKYPEVVKVINKTNGGHGSAINEGLKVSNAKYVRVLDADDWLNEETILQYMDELGKSDEDLILTGYTYNNIEKGEKKYCNVYGRIGRKKLSMSELSELSINSHEMIEAISLHSCTVLRSKLEKVWGKGLLERTLYEDQEYVSKVILAADAIKILNLDVYQYFIGRSGQSVSSEKFFKNRKHHERVIRKLYEEMVDCGDSCKRLIMRMRIQEMIKTHYWIYFYHTGLKRRERREYRRFRKKLPKELFRNITIGFRIRLLIGRVKNKLIKKGAKNG